MTALITPLEVETIARRMGRVVDAHPAEVVAAIERHGQRIAPTLFSAWASEGRELTGMMRSVVDYYAARSDRYLALALRLKDTHPPITFLKGHALAAIYPPGFVRQMHDLDVVAADFYAIWTVAATLLDEGYSISAVTVQRVGGRRHGMVMLEKAIGQFEWPDRVEISTVPLFGDLAGMGPRSFPVDLSPHAKGILLLLEERLQHPFIARDFVDATVLLRSLGDSLHLHEAIDKLDYWPEWDDLEAQLGLLGLSDRGLLGGRRQTRVRRSQVRRALRALSPVSSPGTVAVRLGQRAMLAGHLDRLPRRGWRAMQQLASARGAWLRGLPLFGVSVSDQRSPIVKVHLPVNSAVALLETPAGTIAAATAATFYAEDLTRLLTRVARAR